MLARQLARQLLVARPVAPACRALSSRPQGGRGRRDDPGRSALETAILSRLEPSAPEQPKFRQPPPPVPTTHTESWTSAARLPPVPGEGALEFQSRFYLQSGGEQPPGANKVKLLVHVDRLGLSEPEVRRLVAVAHRGSNYDRKARVLKLSCSKYKEAPRNKEELRQTLGRLVADAREHAEAHAAAPDSQKPLCDRERPWWPDDKRVYEGRRSRWKYHARG
jgi:hypothetical protein